VLGRQAGGDVNGAEWVFACQVDSVQRYEHALAVQFKSSSTWKFIGRWAHAAAAAEQGPLSEVIGRHQRTWLNG